MSGQNAQLAAPLRPAAPAVSQQPFTTMWPSYYANGAAGNVVGGNGAALHAVAAPVDSSQADDADAVQRDREQRILKRKLANRESAKRSKQKRQQADRELQDHATRVDEERDTLTSQLAAAQQRYADAHRMHLELRRKIQAYMDPPSGSAGTATGS